MEITTINHKKLLKDVSRVIRHQKELAVLKGETFNVFSILKMEYRENDVHSAFLGELLKPNGSHGLGSLFLSLFLKHLNQDSHIDLHSAKVVLEKSIGARDDKRISGGRIDIFIEDKKGNTICIENKIDASNQNVQIARYCNYNAQKNKVYYLTLEGDAPSKESYHGKKIDEDFFTISYKSDILEWLEECQKEATNLPILRESIRQYSILIKKLTNQLSDHKMEKEVEDLIIANYSAASVIRDNIWKVELQYAERLIEEVYLKLKDSLSNNFVITKNEDLNVAWTGIKISHTDWSEHLYVKLEGDSKIPWSRSIYGIVGSKESFDRHQLKSLFIDLEFFKSGFRESKVWPYFKEILSLDTSENRLKLFKDTARTEEAKKLSGLLAQMALICEEPFSRLKIIK